MGKHQSVRLLVNLGAILLAAISMASRADNAQRIYHLIESSCYVNSYSIDEVANCSRCAYLYVEAPRNQLAGLCGSRDTAERWISSFEKAEAGKRTSNIAPPVVLRKQVEYCAGLSIPQAPHDCIKCATAFSRNDPKMDLNHFSCSTAHMTGFNAGTSQTSAVSPAKTATTPTSTSSTAATSAAMSANYQKEYETYRSAFELSPVLAKDCPYKTFLEYRKKGYTGLDTIEQIKKLCFSRERLKVYTKNACEHRYWSKLSPLESLCQCAAENVASSAQAGVAGEYRNAYHQGVAACQKQNPGYVRPSRETMVELSKKYRGRDRKEMTAYQSY